MKPSRVSFTAATRLRTIRYESKTTSSTEQQRALRSRNALYGAKRHAIIAQATETRDVAHSTTMPMGWRSWQCVNLTAAGWPDVEKAAPVGVHSEVVDRAHG